MIALQVYGESRISGINDDFEESRDTLRRDLRDLFERSYVEIETESVGGAAQNANLYSLTSPGHEYVKTLSVDSDNATVLSRLDELEHEIAAVRAENRELREQHEELDSYIDELSDWIEHYVGQLLQIAESEHEIVPWTEDKN